jgi:hypothetical protein
MLQQAVIIRLRMITIIGIMLILLLRKQQKGIFILVYYQHGVIKLRITAVMVPFCSPTKKRHTLMPINWQKDIKTIGTSYGY